MDFVGTPHQQIYILIEYTRPKEPFKLELQEENWPMWSELRGWMVIKLPIWL